MIFEAVIYANKKYQPGAFRLAKQLHTAGMAVRIEQSYPIGVKKTGMPWLGGECFNWFRELIYLPRIVDKRLLHGETKPWMDNYTHKHPYAGEWSKKQIYE